MKWPTVSLRQISQGYFLVLYIIIGWFFTLAIALAPMLGDGALRYRSPAIEAFLPISALVGLKQLLALQIYDLVHPAGLTILLLAIISALLLKRGFCSHLCPVGTISELAYKLRCLVTRKPFVLPVWLDNLLTAPKYLLLLFLLYIVMGSMSGIEAMAFAQSPYNIVSDAKMLNFFLPPSPLTLKVLVGLVAFSILLRNFWCRYLCPYGALLAVASFCSPLLIRRKDTSCISCRKCDSVCPSNLAISDCETVRSPECTICQRCLTACPTQSLQLTERCTGQRLSPTSYSVILLLLFALGIGLAKLTNHWDSPVLALYWAELLPYMDSIGH